MAAKKTPINTPTYLRLRQQIREDIVAGQWALGRHLTLRELGLHYEVSNVPVREALLQLQGDGMVEMKMNRGAVVRDIDEATLNRFFDIRQALQTMLVRKACALRTDEQLVQAEALLVVFEAACRRSGSTDFFDAERGLYEFIDTLGDNPHAIELMHPRNCLVEAFRRSFGEHSPRDPDRWGRRARRLVRALIARHPAHAAAAMQEHVQVVREHLLRLMTEAPPSP
ncbi:GntR family transcriptional regulator [Roseateles amylovorans]|uniref:GntR family transcriptional regulator n=1 Tax=Roseateles amylovorans TaxID=2978473 RepID=A0ABY6B2F6_9BURK|nr:GntR family transcriptional regulator [Roseateles amylovorans]UXH78396.1 GntR family transcriptional regulator [Roseateles amylovorans]